MTDPAGLDAPADLWRRWATLAAALSALGHEDVWTITAAGAHHDDGGGNWAHLTLIEGGRAVLYGYDHEYSATVDAEPPLDLLAGAPEWLPWEELTGPAGRDELGYTFWYDAGRWRRVPYELRNGLTTTAGAVLGDDAAGRELAEFVFEWGEHDVDTPAERADVAAAAARLLTGFGSAALHALLARLTTREPDIRAGLAVATRAGLLGDVEPPSRPAGRPPQRRRVRKLSEGDHDRLIWAAMHREPERDRPLPVGTGELGALVTWLRGRSAAGDGRCEVSAYADGSSLEAQVGDPPPAERPGEGNFGMFHELSDLIRRLRAAEADDAYGRWLFLRVTTTATEVTVERRYDAWPSWWPDDDTFGPWRANLRIEIEARAAQWRPGWAALLDPEIAYRAADG
ncbi:hypothetical protein [Symbioplanes lichenis]|uniref:hypothetical protein n=1 Tax=Symbioplanes lichenis TaxID=1629072 RepID=UPI00273A2443|nr:hypothetical protein [Actinoplanes lichenis]